MVLLFRYKKFIGYWDSTSRPIAKLADNDANIMSFQNFLEEQEALQAQKHSITKHSRDIPGVWTAAYWDVLQEGITRF